MNVDRHREKPPARRPPKQPPSSIATAEPPLVDERDVWSFATLTQAVPSWLSSLIVHVLVLLALALLVVPRSLPVTFMQLEVSPPDPIADVDPEPPSAIRLPEFNLPSVTEMDLPPVEAPTSSPPVVELQPASPAPMVAPQVVEFGDVAGLQPQPLIGWSAHSPFGDRSPGSPLRRNPLARMNEESLGLALEWLAAHQLPDGGWSFDQRRGACQGRCSHAGNLADARIGATALALLPFLGAGHTHMQGDYQDTVEAGLVYLVRNMRVTGQLGDLTEPGGNMYSHGLAAIALCEAYAMTHDKGLMQPAQLAINYIVHAQDPTGGGWRYEARQTGDTSVVGWQLMALKSGHLAYLRIDPEAVRGAIRFLDSVQEESGARYGYANPGAGSATTAIGLLCRMYTGWERDNGALSRGVEFLTDRGYSDLNMYYNYYAAQVLRHYEDPSWEPWYEDLSEWLRNTQATEGHEAGSWYVGGDFGSTRGGRLYCTAMAAMMLEVVYRHMPIYQGHAVEEDFPL